MAVSRDNSKDFSNDISFPLTKYSLWDSKPIGPSINVNLLPKHNLFFHISEKLLNILRFSLSQNDRSELIVDFITSLEFSQDENIIFTIERFHNIKDNDNLNFKNNSEIHVKGKIYNNGFSMVNSDEDSNNIKEIEKKLSSEKFLFNFFNFLNANVTINLLSSELEDNIFNINIGTTFISNFFLVVPVKPLPFITTALSNYLFSTNQPKQSININKHGFLSMDQTRKLLLILESDPKVLTLPLVGVWTCAVDNVNHALVAANLIRYVFNSSLTNKICQTMKSFLLVLFPASFGGVEFYQCSINSKDKQYDFISANESIYIDRFNTNSNEVIEIELKSTADSKRQTQQQYLQKSKKKKVPTATLR